ncbi:MAG: hypothetical protein KDA91_23500 [Planctomycetaceae bacterium]|nr:hypothetical protein [Planctomycetaceae bacterium]
MTHETEVSEGGYLAFAAAMAAQRFTAAEATVANMQCSTTRSAIAQSHKTERLTASAVCTPAGSVANK